jgi:hypothetical protein
MSLLSARVARALPTGRTAAPAHATRAEVLRILLRQRAAGAQSVGADDLDWLLGGPIGCVSRARGLN